MINLVLVRHGKTGFNLEKRFCGWTDVDLAPQGIEEAINAGKILKEKGFTFDIAYTSVLKRADDTLNYILKELGEEGIEIVRNWRLNERHYGALQEIKHQDMIEKVGAEQVQKWRRSFDVRPPELSDDDPRYLIMKKKYTEYIPHAESLKDTIERVIPFWNSDIKKSLLEGKKVLIVAHGNSLRGLVKFLDNISDEDIPSLEIPTGNPLVYELDEDLKPIRHYYLKEE